MPTLSLIIITAPSGAGKTSITKYLLNSFPQLGFSVSATTRRPRNNETDGVDYYFMEEDVFKDHIQSNNFIEWEMVYKGKYYGTLQTELQRLWSENKTPVLDIDVQGAIHVRQKFPGNSMAIFIEPPSIDELKKRLESRGSETLESIETRLNKATYELSFKQQFDVIIVNDDLEKACHQTEEVIFNFINRTS